MNKYKLLCTQSTLKSSGEILINFTKSIDMVDSIESNYILPYLILDENGLSIKCQHFNLIYIQDIYQPLNKRLKNLDQELLIKAIKIKQAHSNTINILDLTAGLAKDSLLIAKYGYTVTMIEQNPLLATIIYYAIQNHYLPSNMNIIFMNSIDYLNQLPDMQKPDIIYLDPMFKQNKTAKAKKTMQLIQLITNEEEDNHTNDTLLFEQALKTATIKVVVKRDSKQLRISPMPIPTYEKSGKTVRYDVYTVKNF